MTMFDLVSSLFDATGAVVDGYLAELPEGERAKLLEAMTTPNAAVAVVVDVGRRGATIWVTREGKGPVMVPIIAVPAVSPPEYLN